MEGLVAIFIISYYELLFSGVNVRASTEKKLSKIKVIKTKL